MFWQAFRPSGGGTDVTTLFDDAKENDLINASVSYDPSDSMFYISIADVSQGFYIPKARLDVPNLAGATVESSRFNALCVVESETEEHDLALAQFNTPIEWWGCVRAVPFGGGTLHEFDIDKDAMSNLIPPKATVSPLGRDGAFTVKWLRQ